MGHWVSKYYLDPQYSPDHHNPPTFDTNYGFEGQRKERVMVATEDEMSSAKLEIDERGYCAHLAIAYKACRKQNFPMVYRCHHEKHELQHCQFEDYKMRMMEYERERRLLQRKKRIEAREQRLAGEELAA